MFKSSWNTVLIDCQEHKANCPFAYRQQVHLVKGRIRPLPSSKNPHFQNEAKCTTFLVKMSFICMRMKNHFDMTGWALNLVFIQRPGELENGLLVAKERRSIGICLRVGLEVLKKSQPEIPYCIGFYLFTLFAETVGFYTKKWANVLCLKGSDIFSSFVSWGFQEAYRAHHRNFPGATFYPGGVIGGALPVSRSKRAQTGSVYY